MLLPKALTSDEFDGEFDFDAHEWGCSQIVTYGECDCECDAHEWGCSQTVTYGECDCECDCECDAHEWG